MKYLITISLAIIIGLLILLIKFDERVYEADWTDLTVISWNETIDELLLSYPTAEFQRYKVE